ncbi:hypothetical protein HYPDE_24198 [Hyphomicrobium denitrificans 1NES1]|uniref:Uncharacterized protein n=1 Tax=Hyphomicrobium denitrificans 1NES1 TaxID=670307 RepID=N0B913_9HYPH|nr:hypothetical protein HYPDE_24198 [Hyphomicrobium denitrificans 1NES1]
MIAHFRCWDKLTVCRDDQTQTWTSINLNNDDKVLIFIVSGTPFLNNFTISQSYNLSVVQFHGRNKALKGWKRIPVGWRPTDCQPEHGLVSKLMRAGGDKPTRLA